MRSSWVGLVGAPHLLHDVGISFFGGGALIVVGVGSMGGGVGPDGTVGMGTDDGAEVVGDGVCGVMVTWMGCLVSTSGLPPTAMIPFSVHVLSSRCPSLLSPWNVGPRPLGIVTLNWYCWVNPVVNVNFWARRVCVRCMRYSLVVPVCVVGFDVL